MRKARFNEEQMVAVIREADREPVAVVAKRHGISEQTIYTWRKRFGGFQANDVRRLNLAAGHRRDDIGQAGDRGPMASQWLPPALALALTPSGTTQGRHRNPCFDPPYE